MIGTKIAHYEITSHIGSGGMGDVYQATDTKLGRSVAIKFLPEAFSHDTERVARFQREARVLASLNHSNIAAIYGLEEVDSRHFLVMELVSGETLADRIKRGAIPIEEALSIAKQIAEALEGAHEKGIIHRDLKPANIKLTPEGKLKVLDFGLAKAWERDQADASVSNSPTISMAATNAGVILGTAAYMSPEQAKGRHVDRRADIFAFGCVFYEMLTGKRAFEGEDVSDTLAAVLRAEPDWATLPENVSSGLRTLIQRCLAKDREQRLADISAAKFVLTEQVFTSSSAPSTPAQRQSRLRATFLIATGVLLGAAAVGAFVWMLMPSTAPPSVVRFSISLPEGQAFSGGRNSSIAISPDGTQLVYAANFQLYRRPISAFEAIPIPGTERAQIVNLAFSPDGRSIAFWSTSDDTIKRVPLDGGTPVTVYRGFQGGSTISWGQEGIVFGQLGEGILRVPPDGGTPDRLVMLNLNKSEAAAGPQLLPGANSVLFTLTEGRDDSRWEKAKIVVQSLATGERKTLIDGRDARYLPSGHLVYAVGGIVYAVPFDLKDLTVAGRAVPVLDGVRRLEGSGAADLSVSNTGTLIYVAGPATLSEERGLMVMDRNGSTMRWPVPSMSYVHPRVSRDGKHIAVGIDDRQTAYVSISDLSATSPMRRLTLPNEGHNRFPVWSGDNQHVAFQSDREGNLGIWVQRADGSSRAERLTKPEPGVAHVPESWSPDGQTLLFAAQKGTIFTLWTLSLKDRNTRPFGNVQSTEPIGATFSPDGRWVAYASRPDGTVSRAGQAARLDRGVYVEPFPPTGARYQIPKDDAATRDFHPAWGATTSELFYQPAATPAVISVQTQPNFAFGKAVSLPFPAPLDRVSGDVRDYDVMPDGRFIFTMRAGDETGRSGTNFAPQIRIVLNWLEELKQRVPGQ
jgi:serine/threonine protein kinase